MLKSFAMDNEGRPVLIVGLNLEDIDALKRPDGGGFNIDLARLLAENISDTPPELLGRAIGSMRVVILAGRNDDEIKTKLAIGAV